MAEEKVTVKKTTPVAPKRSDIEDLLDWCKGQGWTNVTEQFDKSDSISDVKAWAQSINHSQVLARISEME
jgi:hypothetical protein